MPSRARTPSKAWIIDRMSSSNSPADPARVVIDLGCGLRKKAGAIGFDIAKIPGVDVVADVMRPLPLRDNSVDEIQASHIVEHVDDLMAFMGKFWASLNPAACYLRFPHRRRSCE